MSLNARNSKNGSATNSNFDVIEPGTYPARVVTVVDVGLQPQRPYKGQEKPPAYCIALTYECLDEFLTDQDGNEQKDRPRHVTEIMPIHSLEADKAKSTKRYLTLDPDLDHDGDFGALVNTPCLVTITNSNPNKKTGKVYANVEVVTAMRAKEAKNAPDLVHDPKVFNLDDPDLEVFLSLPPWMQKMIRDKNLEFEGSKLEKMLKEHGNDVEDNSSDDQVEDSDVEEEEDW